MCHAKTRPVPHATGYATPIKMAATIRRRSRPVVRPRNNRQAHFQAGARPSVSGCAAEQEDELKVRAAENELSNSKG
jgi:hypothetical protein